MTLKLVKLEPKYRRHLNDMMSQWYATGEKIVPYAIRRLDVYKRQRLERLWQKTCSGGNRAVGIPAWAVCTAQASAWAVFLCKCIEK